MVAYRFNLRTTNDSAGGANNEAVTTFTLDPLSSVTIEQIGAQLCAFARYMLPAAGTRIAGIDWKLGWAAGAMLPLGFPETEYDKLAALDANLPAFEGPFPTIAYGDNALTTLGAGAVLQKRTAVPGRSGRGRLTTPWLPVSAVTSAGGLLSTSAAVVVTGWNRYIEEDGSNAEAVPLRPVVAPLGQRVDVVTCAARLGRLRSRTK